MAAHGSAVSGLFTHRFTFVSSPPFRGLMSNNETTKGLALLSMFTPTQIAAIGAAVAVHGSGTSYAAYHLTQRHGNVPPMMSIIPIDKMDDEDVIDLILGLRAEQINTLSKQATRDDYASVLMKMGVPSSLAYRQAEDVLTPDADMRGFVLNSLSWLPAFPFEVGKDIAAGAAGMLQSILPEAWMNRANDRVYEIQRLGRCVRELAKRAVLSRVEVAMEASSGTLNPSGPVSPGTAPGDTAARQTATTMAESMLGMLVGSTLGSALLRRFGLPGIIAGQVLGGLGGNTIGGLIGGGGSAPAIPDGAPTPPALPPGGDWHEGTPEYGDASVGGYNIPPDIRIEAGAALQEFLDSSAEFEQGGWTSVLSKGFKLLKPLATKLAPIAGGAAGALLGGPAGAMLGSKLGSVLGSGLDGGLTPDERYAVATTAATTRSLAPQSQQALRKLFANRGLNTSLADLLAAMK